MSEEKENVPTTETPKTAPVPENKPDDAAPATDADKAPEDDQAAPTEAALVVDDTSECESCQ